MKNNRFIFIVIIILFSLASCTPVKKILLHFKNVNSYGHEQHCRIVLASDTAELHTTKTVYIDRVGFKKGDTVVSIGVGSGWQEFLFSVYTDSITFYLEDIDTSCITREKIKNKYLPYYSTIKGSNITNSFIPAVGTDTSIGVKSSGANKIFILNVYHHFSNDMAMVRECKRILKPGGMLFIDEHVLSRNRDSFKFCDYGGHYKSEKNFVKDIVDVGLKCDTVYTFGKYWRIFVFSKQ